MTDHRVFELGELPLQSGAVCRGARLVYQTYGELAPDRSNVILYPTAFGGQHPDVEWSIASGRALDPSRYHVVVVNMFGNGLSTSPSNTADCPGFTIYDNVAAQRRLLTEALGIERVALVYGRSMGALQAFHWGAVFPEMVERICCICGASRATPHNRLFLQGLRAALTADAAWHDGRFLRPPARGLRAMARVYAGWAMSQAYYREESWRQLGYTSQEAFVLARWEGFLGRRDPHDILAMLGTWELADVAANDSFNGDLDAALGAIRARALVMPSETDLYFPVADSAWEVARMPNAELRPIPSIWGHMAGSWPEDEADVRFIEDAVRGLLAT
jgi:homoserine O-acetyltransferase/O-succinyltransferase